MSDVRAPRDLREWLQVMETHDNLLRITEAVDLDEEMSAIAYMVAQSMPSPVLLFENVKGYPNRSVLFNLVGSSMERYALTLGLPDGLKPIEIIDIVRDRLKTPLLPVMVDRDEAGFYENSRFGDDVNLYDLPAPKHWPLDGGNYIGTADIVITSDPETDIVNVGTYRQMIHDDKRVGVMFSPGKDGRLHMEKWFKQNKPMPIAAVWGINPAMMLVGSAGFPKNVCEYDYAGGMMGEPVKVVKGDVTGLPIPVGSEVVIEGYVYPETKFEGPFGEFTGYYGRPGEEAPFIEVKAIHHRNNPTLTAALMADYPACEQELFLALMRAARLKDDFERLGVPGIKGVYSYPQAAAGFGMTVISLEQQYPGHASQALAIAAQAPSSAYFAKWIIAVDDDVDPSDINQVLWALATRTNPIDDIDILRNTWSTWLDPAQNPPEKRLYASKALINACKQHQHLKTFSKRTAIRRSIYDSVASRWEEFGLPGTPPVLRFFHEN
ncbi:UbiD family decarboxylase [Alicyclobacillus suci]|uniref:UbiD family decarboxylase n=1 Tax=Alicyclobacillus suci TaxID=2816080 RepID=UPI001A8CEB32|nr:UbiD family decarboxylase [Alicyclobacillus suci]